MTKFATRRYICILLAWGLIMAVMLHLSVKKTPPDIPVIYVITPTHTRPTQKADLTQLGKTLRQVPNLHWIVVEDADFKLNFLLNLRISYTHLNVPKPDYCKSGCVARGSEQRNLGLDWLRRNRGPLDSGVVYFGDDDDNTYDLELSEEMRYTKHVSVWPVGLIGFGTSGHWCVTGE
ncbi:galactosylgalactosylxylosylprotein 3-beta-glucuronosyltransferase 2-like [Alosa alosa]|uniref:galactosylgalactosylxylosylprotein 3-beta-glucuronosyltransferase 2-like n=1 Tax=Alosa alosa TaxID=278164 RepID=UPI00201532E5|nr:galactosylgalactosylxylosylprotein 3-beta-glucuronosyltransferase 2-like [Alosa alosa]